MNRLDYCPTLAHGHKLTFFNLTDAQPRWGRSRVL